MRPSPDTYLLYPWERLRLFPSVSGPTNSNQTSSGIFETNMMMNPRKVMGARAHHAAPAHLLRAKLRALHKRRPRPSVGSTAAAVTAMVISATPKLDPQWANS